MQESSQESSQESNFQKPQITSPLFHSIAPSKGSKLFKEYTPLYPEVYDFGDDAFEPEFLEAIRSGTFESIMNLVEQEIFGVFSFPCLKPEFCAKLITELEHLEKSGVPMKRPNSMNRYGAVLADIGFEDGMIKLRQEFINPLAKILFAEASKNGNLLYQHAFTIHYSLGGDKKLSTHVDDADITLNICLGKEFEGGLLFFLGLKDSTVAKIPTFLHSYYKDGKEYTIKHKIGRGLIHLGKHIHGANSIVSGERVNLIVWCKLTPFPQ